MGKGKPKKKRPPVSLHPLEPEEALLGLMQVKPPGKEAVADGDEEAESTIEEST